MPRYLEVIGHVGETRGFAVPTKGVVSCTRRDAERSTSGLPRPWPRDGGKRAVLGAIRFDLKYGMGGPSLQRS